MPRLRRLLRRLIAGGLYFSGLLWLLAEFRMRGRAAVLMYHRVLPADADTFSHPAIIVSPATFAAQMRFLQRHFRLLAPEQFAAELSGPGFGRRTCMVTFDDGWQDNLSHALPILQDFEIPATLFVATAYVGSGQVFWQERLTRLLHRAARSSRFGDEVIRQLDAAHVRSCDERSARCWARETVTTLKRRDPEAGPRLLRQLEAEAASGTPDLLDYGEDRFLDWDDLRRLTDSGHVRIASHSHTHTPLPSLGFAGARSELTRSMRELESHGLPRPTACAYPNGNVDDAVAAAARESGFQLGFATGHGRVGDGDDPLRLRRINIHEQSSATPAEFLCLILGIL